MSDAKAKLNAARAELKALEDGPKAGKKRKRGGK